MTTAILTTVISAITSLLVALGSQYFAARTTRRLEQAKARDRITSEYLTPLRLYLEEAYARLSRIVARLDAEGGTCEALLSVRKAEEIAEQRDIWLLYQGYYLMSSCYVTACLFFHMSRVRDKAPYLPLNPQDDTDLVEQLFEISLAFGKTGGVYYIVQNTLAEAMAEGREPAPISYRRFCEKFRDPQEAVWFKQLVEFYLAVGRGKNRDRLDRAMVAITNLLRFLEKYLGGGTAIETRMIQQFAGDEQP